MKNYLYVLLLFSGFSVNAQIRRFEFSGGIGTNGQIQKVLDDYFYISNPLYILDESQTAETSSLKYSLTGKLFFNDYISLRLRYGHSKTQNDYYYTSYELTGDFWNKQTVTNINPALCLTKSFGKLSISTGIEVAFYEVKNFVSFFEGSENLVLHDPTGQLNYYVSRNVESETVIEGGNGTAVNCFLELEYLLSKRIGVGASVSFGYLWTNFGDNITQSDEFEYKSNNYGLSESAYQQQDKSFKNNSFSPPEISVFLFLRLGKSLEVSKLKTQDTPN